MPVVGTAPYDTVEYVLVLARAMVNDLAQNLSGQLLSDAQSYTPVYLNLGWRYLQKELTNAGVETFAKETILTPVTVVNPIDPATQIYISFTGYFDGTAMHDNPVLPPDMVGPLRLWERRTGSLDNYYDMYPTNDGLPSRPQSAYLKQHDWRQDQLFMTGATQSLDLRMRYNAYFDDLVISTPPAPASTVPILRCAEALAAYTASAFASARGSQAASSLNDMGDRFVQQMTLQTSRKKQRGNHRRIPYSRRGLAGWGWF